MLLISGSQETSGRADFEGQVGTRWSLVTPDMSRSSQKGLKRGFILLEV